MPQNNGVVPWQGPSGIVIPAGIQEPADILPYAVGLTEVDKTQVTQALQAGLYGMSAEYVWKRSMSKLRETLSWLGMEFVGEMLGRDDIVGSSSPESVLTDFDTIRIAEALGVVNETAALRLRHGFEILTHFSSDRAVGQLHGSEAIGVIVSCVQYVLGEQKIGVAVNFSRVRERLLGEVLPTDDSDIDQLISAPPFFLSTTLRVLLSAVKNDHGARLQHALANLNTVLPLIWTSVSEGDRWSVGEAYAETTAAGNSAAILDLKRALLKVKGFDYVPESLRSNTYRKAAKAVTSAHFSWNNFYLETAPVVELARLGSVIPKPAVGDCMQAYLCVYLGNRYGHSFDAAPVALGELKRVPQTSWQYYLVSFLANDDIILGKLTEDKPINRFKTVLEAASLPDIATFDRASRQLIEGVLKGQVAKVQALAMEFLRNLKGKAV